MEDVDMRWTERTRHDMDNIMWCRRRDTSGLWSNTQMWLDSDELVRRDVRLIRFEAPKTGAWMWLVMSVPVEHLQEMVDLVSVYERRYDLVCLHPAMIEFRPIQGVTELSMKAKEGHVLICMDVKVWSAVAKCLVREMLETADLIAREDGDDRIW